MFVPPNEQAGKRDIPLLKPRVKSRLTKLTQFLPVLIACLHKLCANSKAKAQSMLHEYLIPTDQTYVWLLNRKVNYAFPKFDEEKKLSECCHNAAGVHILELVQS